MVYGYGCEGVGLVERLNKVGSLMLCMDDKWEGKGNLWYVWFVFESMCMFIIYFIYIGGYL